MTRPLLLASLLALVLGLGCAPAACPPGFAQVGAACVALEDEGGASDGGGAGDAGRDASIDGGRDAAVVADDAGADAGSDAGTDAHVPCDGACSGATPFCLGETCVACRDPSDCSAPSPFCEPTAHACVACLSSTDCPGTAAVCDPASHTCGPCATNADCAHVAGRGICSAGACVACTVRDETPCGTHSCDPATGSCTTTTVHSIADCSPCLADSECSGSVSRCVPMSFGGVRRPGGFCLSQGTSAASCGTCGVLSEARVSLSGYPATTYCTVPEAYATCESHRDGAGFGIACTQDSDCGAIGLDDGRCSGSHHCWTGCAMTCECPSGFGYTCRADHFCG